MSANPDKQGYELEFFDRFGNATLNTNKWLPYYLPQWSSKDLSRARYRLVNNQLQLNIEADQKPWSPEYNGDLRVSSLQTGCFWVCWAVHKGSTAFEMIWSCEKPNRRSGITHLNTVILR